MASELIGWLEDLRSYVRVIRGWRTLRKPGRGIDYRSDEYTEQVRRTVERLHPRRMQLRVKEVIRQTPTAKTLRFERTDGPLPPFRAGQYVSLLCEIDGVRTSRPLSISSPPGADFLDLTVREKPGGFVSSHLVSRVKAGDTLVSTGPVGGFYYEPLIDGEDLVFLAGGSGITPFMSILRWAAAQDWPFTVRLLYGSRTPDDVIFDGELKALAKGSDRFDYNAVISERPEGYDGLAGLIDADLLAERIGDPAGKTFYLCGPCAMYDFCLPQLEKFGVPRHRIRRELYGPPQDVTREPGWPEGLRPDAKFSVEVLGRKTVEAAAGEPLLCSLERGGLAVEALCRSGECSACRARLLSGRVFMPEGVGLRQSDRKSGYIHCCVSYPLEDLKIRI